MQKSQLPVDKQICRQKYNIVSKLVLKINK